MSQIDKEIGHRLRIARKTAGFKTALDYVNKALIPKSTYSQHENGKRSLTAEQLMQYAESFNIEPNWLLTGLGHPCPTDKNKINRKIEIVHEVSLLQIQKELPEVNNIQVHIEDSAAIVDMMLLREVLTSAIQMVTKNNLHINPEELVIFCIEIYNNIKYLDVSSDEKNKIIALSINSMLRGNSIILNQVINI